MPRDEVQPEQMYPTLQSADSDIGVPIGWGALSALVYHDGYLYTCSDSAYKETRILKIDPAQTPALITFELPAKTDLTLS